MNRFLTRRIVRAALIAAIYVVLCIVFAPFSTAPVQVRVSEALTLLPVLFPEAIAGVTIGCFLSNLILSAPLDMVVGTFTTLIAALLTRKLRNIRWKGFAAVSSFPPVLLNAVVVGVVLTLIYYPPGTQIEIWLLNMASVGLGQLISCSILGVLLVYGIEKNPLFKKTESKSIQKS